MAEGNDKKAVIAVSGKSTSALVPVVLKNAGAKASKKFLEFFAVRIRNRNTREAYYRALVDFFAWCDDHGIEMNDIEPMLVAAYVEYLGQIYSKPTVKLHLAAIRMCFDWLVVGQILPMNPAAAVRGPNHVVKRGKTLVITGQEARQLLDSIDTSTVVGLRDRALIAVMAFSFARVSAVTNMQVRDYFLNGKRSWIRLHEKGGKLHEVPAHHKAEEYVDEYLAAAGIGSDKASPLFRSAPGHSGFLSANRFSRNDAFRMIKRRVRAAGLSDRICCHTFRATGITVYLENGGTIEKAQQIAAHESPRTTKLYDRTNDELTLDEIERIQI